VDWWERDKTRSLLTLETRTLRSWGIPQAQTTSAYAFSFSPRRLVVCAAAPPSVSLALALCADGHLTSTDDVGICSLPLSTPSGRLRRSASL